MIFFHFAFYEQKKKSNIHLIYVVVAYLDKDRLYSKSALTTIYVIIDLLFKREKAQHYLHIKDINAIYTIYACGQYKIRTK